MYYYVKPVLKTFTSSSLVDFLGPAQNQYQAQFTLQSTEFTLSMNLNEPSQKIYMVKISEKSEYPAKYA